MCCFLSVVSVDWSSLRSEKLVLSQVWTLQCSETLFPREVTLISAGGAMRGVLRTSMDVD